VFFLTIIRAGTYPAMSVITIRITSLMEVDNAGATRIPSLNGKSIGFASTNGTKNP